MQKSFSLLSRFFALFVCAFALFFCFACSEDKPAETREEICAKGVSAECLAGEWDFYQVDNEPSYNSPKTTGVSGTLSLYKDGTYCFSGKVNEKKEHCGNWSLTQDGKIHVGCTSGDLEGYLNSTVTIGFSSGTTLKIHGSDKRTTFSDYKDEIEFPNPVEIFRIKL